MRSRQIALGPIGIGKTEAHLPCPREAPLRRRRHAKVIGQPADLAEGLIELRHLGPRLDLHPVARLALIGLAGLFQLQTFKPQHRFAELFEHHHIAGLQPVHGRMTQRQRQPVKGPAQLTSQPLGPDLLQAQPRPLLQIVKRRTLFREGHNFFLCRSAPSHIPINSLFMWLFLFNFHFAQTKDPPPVASASGIPSYPPPGVGGLQRQRLAGCCGSTGQPSAPRFCEKGLRAQSRPSL
ncbi:hypothetical protein CLV89_11660 [Tritonibacter scottomollicae]|uniref:Uncharacterized protein n=1 Tax=Tritonibacter scottomollicae TaxID=483013 RepID=A0A2T1A9U9_TRISK|nr:hypothetical protein CLV89_11660 [Tritonibacter scottomollicae]